MIFEKVVHLIGKVLKPEGSQDGWSVFVDRMGEHVARYRCAGGVFPNEKKFGIMAGKTFACGMVSTIVLPRIYPIPPKTETELDNEKRETAHQRRVREQREEAEQNRVNAEPVAKCCMFAKPYPSGMLAERFTAHLSAEYVAPDTLIDGKDFFNEGGDGVPRRAKVGGRHYIELGNW